MLVSNNDNRRYVSGFTGSAGWLAVSPDQAILATDFRYYEQAELQSPHFALYKLTQEFSKHLPEIAEQAGNARRLGFEAHNIPYAYFQVLNKAAEENGLTLVPTEGVIEQLRIRKDEEELTLIQRAIDLADEAVTMIEHELRPGMTERQAAWEIEKYIREHGGDGLSFETIVGAGPHGALPHWRPTDTPIERGQAIVFDLGARVNGYCSDLTRTIFLGEPDDQFKRVYSIVLQAQLAAEEGVRHGMTGKETDALARSIIEDAGYGDCFGHGLGHGVGLEIHEAPRVSKMAENVTLEDGMVFTVEPGIYLPGEFGVRIEDMAVLENGRARVLSRAAKLDFGGF
jgi:Xaa-Pro aminopeptidase